MFVVLLLLAMYMNLRRLAVSRPTHLTPLVLPCWMERSRSFPSSDWRYRYRKRHEAEEDRDGGGDGDGNCGGDGGGDRRRGEGGVPPRGGGRGERRRRDCATELTAVAAVTAAAKAVEEELRAQLEAKDQALRRVFLLPFFSPQGGYVWKIRLRSVRVRCLVERITDAACSWLTICLSCPPELQSLLLLSVVVVRHALICASLRNLLGVVRPTRTLRPHETASDSVTIRFFLRRAFLRRVV